jgi:hypothetical protein
VELTRVNPAFVDAPFGRDHARQEKAMQTRDVELQRLDDQLLHAIELALPQRQAMAAKAGGRQFRARRPRTAAVTQ